MFTSVYQKYRKNDVETATPQKLILMLYDGALKHLKQAHLQLEAKNLEKCHENMVKTQEIVFELMNALDMEQGEIAGNLYSLYDYLHRRLIEANIKKEPAILTEVAEMLQELRNTWVEAFFSRTNGEKLHTA